MKVPAKISVFLLFVLSSGNGGFPLRKKLPNDLRWVRESKEYENFSRQIYGQAEEKISHQAKQEKGNLVVIDLDETVWTRANTKWSDLGWGWVRNLLPLGQSGRGQTGSRAKAFLRRQGKWICGSVSEHRMHSNLKSTKGNLRALGVLEAGDLFLLRLNKEDTKEIRRSEVVSGTDGEGCRSLEGGGLPRRSNGDFPTAADEALGSSVFVFPNPMYMW